ncbi:MAG: hypothetical protein WD403_10270, partial [Pirellulales bacterium]
PFEQLYATPGIGQKKLGILLCLLERALAAEASAHAFATVDDPASSSEVISDTASRQLPGPDDVSEALWVQWRDTVSRNDLDGEMLGRFASSLRKLPRVVWTKPLGAYAKLTLAEIRAMKTHGEKRVAAVLETFAGLHAVLAVTEGQPHLVARLGPRFVERIEGWIDRQYNGSGPPETEEIRACVIDVLLSQVRLDAGDQVAELVERRLVRNGAAVRQIARRMGLTRARVYQLLAEAGDVMAVRWPDGRSTMLKFKRHLEICSADQDRLELMDAALELFFPSLEESNGQRHRSQADSSAGNSQHRHAG